MAGKLIAFESATVEGQALQSTITLLPSSFSLSKNYPNPFNPSTKLRFSAPVSTPYTLTIYNVTGRVVERITGVASGGVNEVEWNAARYASGMYLYRFSASEFTATGQMILLK